MMKTYSFKCIRADGPRPAMHYDSCTSDEDARRRANALFDLWPLAVKVDVTQGERHFEVARTVAKTQV